MNYLKSWLLSREKRNLMFASTLVFLAASLLGVGIVFAIFVSALLFALGMLFLQVKHVRLEEKFSYEQLEALAMLTSVLPFRLPLPPMRGWAASPDFLRYVVLSVAEKKPRLVVDLGSGVSSIVLGYAVEKYAPGAKVVAYDHEKAYADKTRDLVCLHGLGHVIEVRYAPLKAFGSGEGALHWYDLQAMEDLRGVDLVIVDGPPSKQHPLARYPAYPALKERLSSNALFILDDAKRDAEKMVVARWEEEGVNCHVERVQTEKGTVIFRTP